MKFSVISTFTLNVLVLNGIFTSGDTHRLKSTQHRKVKQTRPPKCSCESNELEMNNLKAMVLQLKKDFMSLQKDLEINYLKAMVLQLKKDFMSLQKDLVIKLNLKSDKTAVNSALAKKANQTSINDIRNLLAEKVNQTAFNALESKTECIHKNSTATDIIFAGCNVHVQSGEGPGNLNKTNGKGNLIIGYNELVVTVPSTTGRKITRNASTDRSGSHNLIVGPGHSYTAHGGIVTGFGNSIYGEYTSVSGGYGNQANGFASSISGGADNVAVGEGASVSSGMFNNASGDYSIVTGGNFNTAGGKYSVYVGDAFIEPGDCTGDNTICPMNSNTSQTLNFTENDLGHFNTSVASSNPLRGFASWGEPSVESLPSSLEYYPVNLSDVMVSDTISEDDWDRNIEPLIEAAVARGHHVILRFVLDTPSKGSGVPSFLTTKEDGVTMTTYTAYGGGKSPDYNNVKLLNALQEFITKFGEKYDGDKRIGFIQVGLLGFWGEWHTYHANGDDSSNNWIPETTKDSVASWFDAAFSKTQIQLRVPSWGTDQSISNFGFYDDSFANMTLGGTAAGGFFWPKMIDAKDTEFWKNEAMGGELFPDHQSKIFDPNSTAPHEDFLLCVNTTHTTYLVDAVAFASTGGYTGETLAIAKAASNRLGYLFQVTKVVAVLKGSKLIEKLTVYVTQRGVAPFYYPLSLVVACSSCSNTFNHQGLEKELINEGDVAVVQFDNVNCMYQASIKLFSNHTLENQEIRFAQGDGTVAVWIPQ